MNNPFETVYDVAVFGGGMSGAAAALKAAEGGSRVLLVERRSAPGWEVTSALNCSFEKSEKSVAAQLYKQLNSNGCLCGGRVDSPSVEILLIELFEKNNIDLLLFSQPLAPAVENGEVQGVWIGNKEGEQLIRARAYVDATENALLWRNAGAELQRNATVTSKQSFFLFDFEYVKFGELDCGELRCGAFDIRLFPSIRKKELCVEFTLPEYSDTRNRAAVEEVAEAVRVQRPELANAYLTHASFEPFPSDTPFVLAESVECHSEVNNLFGAGIWMTADNAVRQKQNTLAGRLDIGEQAADLVMRKLDLLDGPDVNFLPENAPVQCTLEADLVIAGGGTSGSLSAMSAGREGVDTILLEAGTFLGGMVTGSTMYFSWHGAPGGLQRQVEIMGHDKREIYIGNERPSQLRLHPEMGKIRLESDVQDHGVKILYGSIAIGVEKQNDRITGVYVATPDGKTLIRTKFVIDATGDADIAAKAGAECIKGRSVDGALHAFSQCAQVWCGQRVGSNNFDVGYVDPTSVVDLTRGRLAGVRELQKRFPRTVENDSPIHYICPLVGIRQSRQIVGDYVQTMGDQLFRPHFEDCVGWSSAKYDCHSQDPENQDDLPILWVWFLGKREVGMGGQIPYRVMLPKGLSNIWVPCRAASSTDEANYQLRTIRNRFRLGEAASISVAMCLRDGVDSRGIDLAELQNRLVQSGALDRENRPKPPVENLSLDQIRKGLHSNEPSDAVWHAATGGVHEEELLLEFVKGDHDGARFWSAVALAWRKHEAAVPVLIEAVEERMGLRTDFTPWSRNMRPLWQSCVIMLGRIGDKRAVPTLIELVDNHEDFDVVIAAVRALGRIGDSSVVPSIEAVLNRELNCARYFQQTNPNAKYPTQEDGRWQLDLAVVDVLRSFGKKRDDILKRYADDPRFAVRRYVEILQK